MSAQQPQLPFSFANLVLVSDNAPGHSFVGARNRRQAMRAFAGRSSSSCPADLSAKLADLKLQAVFRPGKNQSFAPSRTTRLEPSSVCSSIDEDSSDRWNGCRPKKHTTSTVSLPQKPSRRRSLSPESIKKARSLEAQCSIPPQLQYAKALRNAKCNRGLISPQSSGEGSRLLTGNNSSPTRSRTSKAA